MGRFTMDIDNIKQEYDDDMSTVIDKAYAMGRKSILHEIIVSLVYDDLLDEKSVLSQNNSVLDSLPDEEKESYRKFLHNNRDTIISTIVDNNESEYMRMLSMAWAAHGIHYDFEYHVVDNIVHESYYHWRQECTSYNREE